MVGLQTLNLAIGVRVPASQPKHFSDPKRAALCSIKLAARLFLLQCYSPTNGRQSV